jgi:hypothetical protein
MTPREKVSPERGIDLPPFVSSLHRFTMAKTAEFHEIGLDFMKSGRIS